MYEKEYFTDVTVKEVAAFRSYVSFLSDLGIKLSGKKVLDVGCATGEFIENIVGHSDCYGCDISSYAVTRCQEKFPDIKDHFFSLDVNREIVSRPQKFDIVTLFDVIEHLTNFDPLREMIKKNLEDGGTLVVTTPNANSLTRLIGQKNFTGELDATHTVLFTPYTLDFFLRRLGLTKVANFTPYIFYFKMNFLTKRVLLGGQIVAIYRKGRVL